MVGLCTYDTGRWRAVLNNAQTWRGIKSSNANAMLVRGEVWSGCMVLVRHERFGGIGVTGDRTIFEDCLWRFGWLQDRRRARHQARVGVDPGGMVQSSGNHLPYECLQTCSCFRIPQPNSIVRGRSKLQAVRRECHWYSTVGMPL